MGGKEQAKEAGQKFELPTDRLPDAEEVARYIKDRPELERPLIFPNHQKQFIAFTWLSCAAMTFYFVFWHEFPQEEHCFSGIRRYVSRWKHRFFSVGDEEQDAVQKRIKELQKKIEEKKALENKTELNPTS